MASSSGECPAYGLLSTALTGDLNLLKKSIADLDDGVGLARTIEYVQDCQGRTALHYAASEGRTYICKYLVQGLKLDVIMKDKEGETPLSCATLRKKNQTVRFLLENGANPNLANDKGCSALHYAAIKGLKELTRLLSLKGAEIDVKSDAGTPLHCAAAQGKKDFVKILLDKKANAGADPNLGQLNGESLLGFAASQGESEVMKCLLKAGANPNVTNYIGLTPLEIVVLHGNHEKVKILFKDWLATSCSLPYVIYDQNISMLAAGTPINGL